MELRHTIELLHLSARHSSREIRGKAIAEYLRCHPEINNEEAATLLAEAGLL